MGCDKTYESTLDIRIRNSFTNQHVRESDPEGLTSAFMYGFLNIRTSIAGFDRVYCSDDIK